MFSRRISLNAAYPVVVTSQLRAPVVFERLTMPLKHVAHYEMYPPTIIFDPASIIDYA